MTVSVWWLLVALPIGAFAGMFLFALFSMNPPETGPLADRKPLASWPGDDDSVIGPGTAA